MNITSMRLKALFLVLTACLHMLPLSANEIKFSHLTVNEGLSHNSSTCITQDSIGYIWFGTQRGLNRYDGYKIDAYLNETDANNTLYDNRIKALTINGNYLWVATFNSLLCFDIRKKSFISFEDNQLIRTTKNVFGLFVDSKNRIWLLSTSNLICASIEQNKEGLVLNKLKIDGKPELMKMNQTTPEVVQLKNGTIVLLVSGKLYQEVNQGSSKNNISLTEVNIQHSEIKKIKAEGNELWLFKSNKAYGYKNINVAFVSFDSFQLPTIDISGIEFSRESIWLSSRQGLIQIDRNKTNNRLHRHPYIPIDPSSVCSDHQSSIFIDKNNNLWISTWAAGISFAKIGKHKFELVKHMPIESNKYLPSEFVFSIHEDVNKHIYVGTKFGGISRFNPNTKTFDYTLNIDKVVGLKDVIPCLVSDKDWVYAIVTSQGSAIYKFHKKTKRIEFIKGFGTKTAFSCAFDKHQQLWVGVLNEGLVCLKISDSNKVSEKWFYTKSDTQFYLTSNQVNYVFSDTIKNEILVSTTNGLNRFMLDNNGNVEKVAYYLADKNNKNSLSSNYLWPIDKENDSTYWIGTLGNGLNRIIINNRQSGNSSYFAEHFGTNEGAPSDNIESVLVDKYGHVWCAGLYLSQFNYKTKRFTNYYEEDGLQSYLFATGTSCKASSGMLYLGGLKGMNYFMPDTVSQKNTEKSYFSRIYCNGQQVNVGDTINGKVVLETDLQFIDKVKIPYPCNGLRIEFTTLNYVSKRSMFFRYKLEGYDEDWKYTDGTKPYAVYPKLPLQTYTFILESGDGNSWLSAKNELTITISAPWWRSNLAYLIYFALFCFLIYAILKYSINWIKLKREATMQFEREKQKEQMIEMKMNFFTNISHEFKTPLTLINAAISQIESMQLKLSGKEYFSILKRNNTKLTHLISELMDFQKINASLLELKPSELNVSELVSDVVDEFEALSKRSNIDLTLTLPSQPIIALVDEECLVKIITNVISNALRYTEKGGSVHVDIFIGKLSDLKSKYENKILFESEMYPGEHILFRISDTGIGITKESISDVFERYHTVISKTSKHLGSGVGLALVKSLVLLQKGGIMLSSLRNVGTEFVFTIPFNNEFVDQRRLAISNHFDRKIYFDDYKAQMYAVEEKLQINSLVESKPTLLIVDDNKEIVLVLSNYFEKDFNILVAYDGEEALQVCNEKLPDLIISDIMMPKISGLELCHIIKSQLTTMYIPVILLTARGTVEQKIEGIDEGADAYIPKPFHLGLLLSNVNNLLIKANASKQLFEKNNATPSDIRQKVIKKEKNDFMEKLMNIIEKNIDNPNYNIESLCNDIGISRSRLYALMKANSDHTLGYLIREVRLQKASELLLTSDLSISDIAFRIGIENPSIFTRSFKERFGLTPTDFLKINKSKIDDINNNE